MSRPALITRTFKRKWNGCEVTLDFLGTRKHLLFWHKYDRLDTVKLRLIIKRIDKNIKDDVLCLYEAISKDGTIAEELLIHSDKIYNQEWALIATPITGTKIPSSTYCIIYNIRGMLADKYTQEIAWLGKELL